MLFHVRMDVHLPHDLDPDRRADLLAREAEYSQRFQSTGVWRELWRVVGRFSNISIIDVATNDELHQLLSGLPLYPYMDITVTPLAQHPNRIDPGAP